MESGCLSREKRKGFTLVELLVVIGIIAVLISILLPSLNAARRQANAVKCASNLKQFGAAFSFYASENKGYWPMSWYTYAPPGTPETTIASRTREIRWYEFLGKYFNNGKPVNADGQITVANKDQDTIDSIRQRSQDNVLWGCPNWDKEIQYSYTSYATKPAVVANFGSGASKRFMGYQMNGYVVDTPSLINPTTSTTAVRGNIYSTTSTFSWGQFPRPSAFKPQTGRALVFDAVHYNISISLNWPWWDTGTWGNDQPTYPDGANYVVDFNRHSRTRSGTKADQKSLNMLFADLHVESVSSREAFRAIRGK